jgi:hypothetical protein
MPYSIDGQSIQISDEPQLRDGTLWVPLRALGEELGAKVDYEASNRVALVYHGDNIITVSIGQQSVDLNGQAHQLQAAPYVENGETWVPVRFFSNVLGFNLDADPSTGRVDFSSPV